MLTEDQLDGLIASQYAIANLKSMEQLKNILQPLKTHLDTILICQILLHSLPSLICDSTLIDVLELIFEGNSNTETRELFFDIASFFETSGVPQSITQLVCLNVDQKRVFVENLLESFNEISSKYDFSRQDATFDALVKSFIVRLNCDFTSFEVTNLLVDRLKTSKFASLDLLDWINYFYIPISSLDRCVPEINYTLRDFQVLITNDELVEIIMANHKSVPDILDHVLAPYINYASDDIWKSFLSWTKSFVITGLEHPEKMSENYQLILSILRQDLFLNQLNSTTYIDEFVKLVLTFIYLTPQCDLQIFINMKEILILLKSFSIPDGNTTDLLTESNFDEVLIKLAPTKSTIALMIKVVEIGETLYNNDLSFLNVLELRSANKEIQMTELIKFIDNEVTVETTGSKWKLFLTSTYTTLKKTEIFNQISIEEFSEVILQKLLDLKRFEVIQTIFNKDFNYLPETKYQEIVERKCWTIYMNTFNNLDDCKKCLELLNENSHCFKQLTSLICANEKMRDWKFYLKPGTHATPKDIYNVQNPIVIIRKIFELNDNAFVYLGDIYHLLELLIVGMGVSSENPLYDVSKSYDDPTNLLALKLKLICLEFTSAMEYTFSFDLAFSLLSQALTETEEIANVVSENWFAFFQLSKIEYEVDQLELLDNKLNLLSKLLLLTPTEYNTIVLEQWQMLNSQKQALLDDQQQQIHQYSNSKNENGLIESFGDVQSRLQRSLKESADELMNNSSSDIGKNIIGWIVGAN
ncbi:hypothetical protein CANINC_000950 [Pichia inconspicua]|uniref:Sec39 domain-containing protein n=1 Tax=Pichia inconspicua TaxID=52247 RepID=A0A4T0X4U9_9ASCO|nr:hypothetical protein CANINC_000950 [[Candida] inconspicua]